MRALPPTISVREAASLLGIGHSSAYAAIRAGEFPAPVINIGGRYVVPTKPLLDLLGLDQMDLTTTITCPRCAAPADDPCLTAGGNVARAPYVVRIHPVEAPAAVEDEDVTYSIDLTTDPNEEVFLWNLRRNGTLIGRFARHDHAERVIDALLEGEPELVDLPLNEMVELLVHDLRLDHYEIIATPRPVAHTPTDSLAYIGRAVNGLIDLASAVAMLVCVINSL